MRARHRGGPSTGLAEPGSTPPRHPNPTDFPPIAVISRRARCAAARRVTSRGTSRHVARTGSVPGFVAPSAPEPYRFSSDHCDILAPQARRSNPNPNPSPSPKQNPDPNLNPNPNPNPNSNLTPSPNHNPNPRGVRNAPSPTPNPEPNPNPNLNQNFNPNPNPSQNSNQNPNLILDP